MSSSSFRTVCFATPVIRQVALIETPSTKADITCTRFVVLRRFINRTLKKDSTILLYFSQLVIDFCTGFDYRPPMIYRTAKINTQETEVIEKIETVRRKLRHNLAAPRRWMGLLRRNTFARAIQGSNSIEGYNVTLDDAVAAVEGEEPLDATTEAWLAVAGYRTAMTFVLQLAKDKSFQYSEGFLRSLHFMMLQHDLAKNPGNWRPGTIYVREEASGEIVYEGPEVELVPSFVAELIQSLNSEDFPHSLIKGAMAHLNLVMIHPFSDGNGRMARCLQSLVLAREGILEPEFASIEEYLGRNTPAYYAVLGDTSVGEWSPKNSTRKWIQFNLTAHYRQAMTLLNRTTVMDLLWQEMETLVKQAGLPERVLNAVCDGAIGYRVRNAGYRKLANLNDILASRDLRAAVASGLLMPIGERRGRIYTGAPHTRAIFESLRREHVKPVPDPFAPEQLMLPG
jgi:Fic family protein